MSEEKIVTASFLIIGDEILSGRTIDQNLNFLAQNLSEIGIKLLEVRVVPDVEDEIIAAINALRAKFDYVFTSGGIGPTHDDITSSSVAKAFNDDFILNKEAEQILYKHYGKENINEASLKMAYLPKSAKLLDNPVSSAPGFNIENVFVMAGVPKIFQAMFNIAKNQLKTGKKIKSHEITLNMKESEIAKDLADKQQQYPSVSMGSYPANGKTSLVLRSADYEALEKSKDELLEIIKKIDSSLIIEIK